MIPERTQGSKKALREFCEYITAIHGINKLTILEIGSWTGASAEIFAQYFKSVTCIDPWEETKGTISSQYNMKDVEAIFDNRIKKYTNITKIKARSEAIVDKTGQYDIIYIDGEHTYEACKRDIKNFLPKARLYITGHDYDNKKFPGVVKAVDELLGKPIKVFRETSWIHKKELK